MNKKKQLIQALGGIVCLVAGALLALYPTRRYEEHRYIVDAAACRMDLLMVSRADLLARPDTGSVVVLHGISANKIIMQYLARSLARNWACACTSPIFPATAVHLGRFRRSKPNRVPLPCYVASRHAA